MKASELRNLSREELEAKYKELAEERFRLKFQHSIRPIDNPARLSLLRKDMARIKTVLNQKQNG